jgi:hypothetical protein
VNRRLSFTIMLCGLGAFGCSDDRPPLAEVRGTVTLDGKPLPGKSIVFVPEPATPGAGAGAKTRSDGSYHLLALRANVTRDTYGVVPGDYRVIINEPIIPIDIPADAPTTKGEEPVAAIGPPPPPRRGLIPHRYTTAELTDLRVTVPPEGGTFDFALTTRP